MLGDLVRVHRRQLGLSQEDLAALTGISARAIRKIESRQTGTPRPATVRLLADALELEGAERVAFIQSAGAAKPEERPQPVRSAPPYPAAAAGGALLVGREAELSLLDGLADAAAAGGCRIVWLGGEAGAGKSALSRQFAEVLAAKGWNTAAGGVPEVEGTPPAWAWAEVIHQLAAGEDEGSLEPADARLVERLHELLNGRTTAASISTGTVFWQARAVVRFLGRCTRTRPLLIVLDDVHRAGEETLQILRYAGTELAEQPLLIVATFRSDDATPALTTTWAALAGPRASHVKLAGLAEADVARILTDHLGKPIAPDMVRLITQRTGGNPLFVGETARLVADEGLAAASQLVPTGVGNVLRQRLARLPAAAQAILRTAAVIGLQIDTEILLTLPSVDLDTALDGVEAALRAGLLTESPLGVVRFSHVLVRDTIYQDLSQARRARLHAEVLAGLRRSRSGDVAALAHHALASAGPATARSAALDAAEAARAASGLHAHQEAAALLSRALTCLEQFEQVAAAPETEALRVDLLCELVAAQSYAGNVIEARANRDRVVSLAQCLGRPEPLARAYTAYAAPALWTLQSYQRFDQALVEGIAAALRLVPDGDSPLRCRLLATLAIETETHDLAQTDRASAEATAMARRLCDAELICYSLNARYRFVAALGPDRWSELDDIGLEQLAVATSGELCAYQTQAHFILGMARLGRNDLDGAQRHLDWSVEHATTGQLGLALGILAMFKGLRHLIAGRFDDAERSYKPAMQQLRAVGNPNVAEVELLVAFSLAHVRDGEAGRQRMQVIAERAQLLYKQVGDAIADPYARVLIGAGQLEEARAVWKPVGELPRDYYWFRWTVMRAENALHLGDRATIGHCYQQLRPWSGHLPGLLHAHMAFGPVDHTLGDLAAALDQPAAAVEHYTNAVKIAEQIGAPHWTARSRRALAKTQGVPDGYASACP